MQSILQYRRFQKHVTRQYERDKSKVEAQANPDASGSTSPLSSNRGVTNAGDHIDTRDPEKGEHSNGQPVGAHDHAKTHDPEKEGESYAPLQAAQAAPTGKEASQGGEAPADMRRVSKIPTGKSTGTALGTTLTGIDVRDRSTKEGGDGKVFVVGYEGENDIMNPHNWSFSTRIAAT